ncbi:MAG: L-threonylcarbamoyladenylate synthase [Candidatus Bathyarchaeota archaeon]|jgi:L-threonylcarbamoyladenylate synthase|nr:L-threonylcarbamoyladenylate synthase [Candidatus Bathyarchaeota archaeon]
MTLLKATRNNIMVAARIVERGGLVVYPTETVYGLGCNPFNVEAVKRILKVKGDRRKPLPVLAASIDAADKVAFIPQIGKRLAAKFWPGPLTLVFPKKPALPDVVTFGRDSVGLRIPDNDVALHLISLSGGLLIGSSANRTGEEPPRTVQEISGELKEMVDVVLDGGATVQGRPSTVADLTSEKPRILREGPISLKEILDALALGD